MSNPFNDVLDYSFRGKHVHVAGERATYEGYCARIHHQRGSVVLFDAERIRGDDRTPVGCVFVRTVSEMFVTESQKRVVSVPLAEVAPAPWHDGVDEVAATHLRGAARDGFAGSFPVVRHTPTADRNFQLINGHRRVEACRRVGLTHHPVEVIDCSADEARELFELAHGTGGSADSDADSDAEVACDGGRDVSVPDPQDGGPRDQSVETVADGGTTNE